MLVWSTGGAAALLVVYGISIGRSTHSDDRSANRPSVQPAGGPAVATRRRETTNIAAYELYRAGSDQTLQRSDSGLRAAIGDFQQAIALDSAYPAAHAGLSQACMTAVSGSILPLEGRRAMFRCALNAAQRAVRSTIRSPRGIWRSGWYSC